MRSLILEPTNKTPKIILSPDLNLYEIEGRSIAEDAVGYWQPILKWIDESTLDKSKFKFNLSYFNTSSSKMILEIFRKLEKKYKSGYQIEIEWCCDFDDDDMIETGEDYKALVTLPFNIKKI
jgi:hypothetical protein